MNKIGRILKAVGKGVVKALPFVNVAAEIKDVNVRGLAKSIRSSADSGVDGAIKSRLYHIADLMDDGKANQSMDEVILDRFVEVFVSLGTSAALIFAILNEIGVL